MQATLPQQPMMQQPQPQQSNDCKLHIKNIAESVTEEMLWKIFKDFGNIAKINLYRDRETKKSRGYAKITFQTPDAAQKARKELNFSYLYKQDIAKNQKRILISKNLDTSLFNDLKTKNIYLNLPKIKIDHKDFFQEMTQYGEILSLSLPTGKDNDISTGFGFILFEKPTDNDKFLEKQNIQYKEHTIKLEKYILPNKREHKTKKNLYIKDFIQDLTEAQADSEESRKTALDSIQKFIVSKVTDNYGQVESCIVSVNPKNKQQVYAFLTMVDESKMDLFIQDYENNKQKLVKLGFLETIFINNVNQNINKSQENQLLVRSLKLQDTDEEQKRFEEKIKEVLGKFGSIKAVSLYKSNKPATAQAKLQDANQAIVTTETEDDATQILVKYLHDQEVRSLFLNENPNQGITLKLPKSERKKMLRAKEIEKKQNFQQIATVAMQQQPMANFNQMQRFPNPRQRGQQHYQQRRPMQQQQQQNYQQTRQQQIPQQANRQQAQQIAPRPVAQVNSAPQPTQQQEVPLTLEQLKQNLSKFMDLDAKQQSQILGNLLFPKVKALCAELKMDDQNLPPKITGMLIDFSVFEVSDIVETLENPEELKERVVEADSLIKQAQQ